MERSMSKLKSHIIPEQLIMEENGQFKQESISSMMQYPWPDAEGNH